MWDVVLTLDRNAPVETEWLADGVTVRTSVGTPALRIEGIHAASDEEAHSKALVAANRFLDGVHLRFGAVLAVQSTSWTAQEPERGKIYAHFHEKLSLFASERIRVEMTSATTGESVVVYDSERPGPLCFTHSEAQAYYRKARCTEDTFEKFRNLYLAAESVGHRICVATGATPADELARLEFALNEAFTNRAQLLREAAATSPHLANGDVVHNVAKLLYVDNRCALNHARPNQSRVPFNPADEEQVKGALPLMEFAVKALLTYEESVLAPVGTVPPTP